MKRYRNLSRGILSSILLGLLCCQPSTADAQVIDLSTPGNASDWLVTGAGASDAPAFQTNFNRTGEINISTNGEPTGTFVTGASSAAFNGFWYAENSFFLPTNATNVSLDFDGLWGNDRVVLSLNGTNIGNATFANAMGNGLMRFTENGADDPFTFTNTDSGTVNSGFVVGGNNVLRITVNNTGTTYFAATTPSVSAGDVTSAHLPVANVNFTAVPEPAAIAPLFAILALIAFRRRRKLTAG